MVETVYVLCALASGLCVIMLWRGYLRTRKRLLLWSCICFLALTVNNIILFLDKVIFPDVDLSFPRSLSALGGLLTLVYGLIWDSEQ